MKRYFKALFSTFFFTCYFTTVVTAQVGPQNSLYLTDLYQINKAYAGLDKSLSINVNHRSQWTGIVGTPRQTYLNAHLPIYLINGAVGANLHTDKTGALTRTKFAISYNYIRKINNGIISTGLSLGINQSRVNGSELVTPEGIYNGTIFSHEDPILREDNFSGISPEYSLDLFIGHQIFDFGLSIENLGIPIETIGQASVDKTRFTKLFVRFPLYINDLLLYPSVLVKTNFDFYQTDVSILGKSGNVFGGLSLRGFNENSIDALVFIMGIKINEHVTLNYGYDWGLGKLQRISSGSHEFGINYNLNRLIGIGLLPEIIYNPRSL